ncbi:MAG: DUF6249 domain-containing protein [Candidatus Kapaibacterium sp.]
MTGKDLENIVVPIFAFIFIFGFPAIIILWAIYTKHRERMRLIEKGISPDEAKKYFTNVDKKPRNAFGALKWGILFLFLGAGIFTANILEQMYDLSDGVTSGLVIFFIGLGFVVYFLIANSKSDNKPAETKPTLPNN